MAASARPLALGALLAWVALVLAAYYAVHKPLPPSLDRAGDWWALLGAGVSWRALLATLWDLAASAWVVGAALGCGAGVLRRAGLAQSMAPLQGVTFATALGLGLLGLAAWVLAVLQFFTPTWLLFTLGACTAVALAELPQGPLPWLLHLAAGLRGPQPLPVRLLQASLLLGLALVASQALAPPTAWDALVYHLTAPRHYLALGGYQAGLDIPHAYFPSLLEHLFVYGLSAGSDSVPALLHLWVAVLGYAALYGFLRSRADATAAWCGAAVLASVASLWTLASRAYVDWGLVTFGFLSFWALDTALQRLDRRWLVVSAVLAGMTMGVKYTGVFLAVGLAAVLAWQTLRPGRAAGIWGWRAAALWTAVAALVVAPWLLRNLVLTGNPVYPFLFGGWAWDPWKTAWITRPGSGLIAEPLRALSAPWEVTVLGREGGLYDAALGPLLLALLPVALVGVRGPQGEWAGRALCVAGVGYAGWLLGAVQSALLMQGRLLLPVAPFLAAAVAAGLRRIADADAPPVRAGRVLGMAVALAVALQLATLAAAWAAAPPLPVLTGAVSRSGYTELHLGEYAAALRRLNAEVPAQGRVLFLWEPRTYLCQRHCQADALLYNWRFLLHQYGGDPDAVADALRREGYTHVLVYGGGLRFFATPPNVEAEPRHVEALLALLDRHARAVFGQALRETLALAPAAAAGRGYALYALAPAGP